MSLKLIENVLTLPAEPGQEMFFDSYEKTLYGYANESGEVVIEPVYFSAEEFSEGLALVSTDTRPQQRFYINENNEIVIDITKLGVDRAGPFRNGLALLRNERTGKHAIINKKGHFLTEFEFDEVGDANLSKLKTLCRVIEWEGAKALNWAEPDLLVSKESMHFVKKAVKNYIILNYSSQMTDKETKEFVLGQKETMNRIRSNKLLNIVGEITTPNSARIEKLLE